MDNNTKYYILEGHIKHSENFGPVVTVEVALDSMEYYAARYKRVAFLISAIFFHGKFQSETPREKELQHHLEQLGLWPTTEDEVIKRLTTNED